MALDNLIALGALSAIFIFLVSFIILRSSSRQKTLSRFYADHNLEGAITPGRWNKHAENYFCFYRMAAISLDLYEWAGRDLEKARPNDDELRVWLIKHQFLNNSGQWFDFIVLPSLPENTIKIIV